MGAIRTKEVDDLMRTEIPPIHLSLPFVEGKYEFTPHVLWTESSKDGVTIDSVEGIIDITFVSEKDDERFHSSGFHFQERKVFAQKISEDKLVEHLIEAVSWLKSKRLEIRQNIQRA